MSSQGEPQATKCFCKHIDARACFLARHPECNRRSDDMMSLYDVAVDEICECCCHAEPDEEYLWNLYDREE